MSSHLVADEALVRRPESRFRRVASVTLGIALGVLSPIGVVHADDIDPNVPSVVSVGAPRGPVNAGRLDGRRSGFSRTALPKAPTEMWRRSLGTIEVAPLIDESGSVTVALASAELVKLSSQGKEIWRTRLQGGGPAAAPIRLSDGCVGVVSTGGFFIGVNDKGKVRFVTPLGARGPDLLAAPVATDDGGAAVVAGRSLITIDADGRVQTETALPGHVSSPPVVFSDGFLLVADDGSVVRVRAPKQAQTVGSFQGQLDGGAVLADQRTLLGVMRDRLLALDLRTGVVSVRATTSNYALIDGPVVVSSDRRVFFSTTDGLLVALDRTGQETSRATIERVSPPPTQLTQAPGYPPGYGPGGAMGSYGGGGYMGQVQPPRVNPPLVVDAAGRPAFVRSAGRLGMWAGEPTRKVALRSGDTDPSLASTTGPSKDPRNPASTSSSQGAVDVVTEHICNTPLAVLPAGENRIAVVCREGLVAVYGD